MTGPWSDENQRKLEALNAARAISVYQRGYAPIVVFGFEFIWAVVGIIFSFSNELWFPVFLLTPLSVGLWIFTLRHRQELRQASAFLETRR